MYIYTYRRTLYFVYSYAYVRMRMSVETVLSIPKQVSTFLLELYWLIPSLFLLLTSGWLNPFSKKNQCSITSVGRWRVMILLSNRISVSKLICDSVIAELIHTSTEYAHC